MSTSQLNTLALREEEDKRKLIKLHWREAHIPFGATALRSPQAPAEDSIWSCLSRVEVDREKLAHLFELKQTEVKAKVSGEVLFVVIGLSLTTTSERGIVKELVDLCFYECFVLILSI